MKKYTVMLTVLCMILSGCASGITAHSLTSGSLIDNHTSYFDHYHSLRNNDKYDVEGTVYQGQDGDNAVIAEITAKDEAAILITGTAKRVRGDLQLVYTADDGTQTLIADADDKSIDAEIIIPEGNGRIHFKGNGKKAVYDFDLHIEADDNSQIKDPFTEEPEAPKKTEIPENLETIPEEIEEPEKEELPEAEDSDSNAFPHIHNNWPEDITFEHHGIYADKLTATLEIDEPVTLSVSCVTDDGKMDMKIVGPDQETYFDRSDIQTGEDTVDVDMAGTYQIVLHLEYHEGSIVIKPL